MATIILKKNGKPVGSPLGKFDADSVEVVAEKGDARYYIVPADSGITVYPKDPDKQILFGRLGQIFDSMLLSLTNRK